MVRRLLEPFPVSPTDTSAFLDALEGAIAGQRTLLPLPATDHARSMILSNQLKVRAPIDPDIALVVATSGSTGTPKGALLTPHNLVSSADATHQFLGGAGAWLLALPPHHIAGIQVLIRSLVAGIEPLVQDVTHGFNIDDFANAAQELRLDSPRCYTSLTPMQLLKAMDTLQGIEALRLFDAILVGGAPLRYDDRRAAKELGITAVTTYGSSETAGGCVYNGRPLPGVTVRVVGERIILGGPMIAAGYRNLPDHEDFQPEGFFKTSDTGYLKDGILTVTGRLDTVIVSGGLKIHPEVLEEVIREIPGIYDVCVVGVPDRRLGQAIAAVYTGTATAEDIIESLHELPRWQLPKDIMKVEMLPLTGPGKVDRSAIMQLFV